MTEAAGRSKALPLPTVLAPHLLGCYNKWWERGCKPVLEGLGVMVAYYIKLYLLTLIAFFAIDMVWLGLIARGFYQQHLGFLLRSSPNWTAAIIFYLLFVLGIVVFVITPGLQAGSVKKVLLLGALFGIVTYATYDLTNLATVKNWPWIVTVVDIAWGCVLATSVGFAGFLAGKWLSAAGS